ncbi:amidohydrolase family protein [Caballeronia sp. HLA56]
MPNEASARMPPQTEAAIEANLPVIDAHHHLWAAPRPDYLFPEYAADTAAHRVVGSVFVECRTHYEASASPELAPLGETAFALAESARAARSNLKNIAAGIIGYADLTLGAGVARVIDAHREIAGNRFVGIRNIAAWHADSAIEPSSIARPPEKLLYSPAFREGFRELPRYDLTFDTYVLHTQLDDVRDLARAFPQTRIVVNHAGGPLRSGPRDQAAFQAWRTAMQRLSACENVAVKIGGFGMPVFGFGFAQASAPVSSDTLAQVLRPYFDCCIELFGAERCMVESNFPVDRIGYSYTVFLNALKKLSARLPADERRHFFLGTADRIYGLGLADSLQSELS